MDQTLWRLIIHFSEQIPVFRNYYFDGILSNYSELIRIEHFFMELTMEQLHDWSLLFVKWRSSRYNTIQSSIKSNQVKGEWERKECGHQSWIFSSIFEAVWGLFEAQFLSSKKYKFNYSFKQLNLVYPSNTISGTIA